MKKGTKTVVTIAGAAAAGGALYMFLRRRQSGTTQQAALIQQTGLVPQPTATTTPAIETYYQPVPGITPTEPTAAALVEARRCFILFIEAYSRYYYHKLPYDLTLMKSLMLKMYSPEYNWITRQDIWAYDDYNWLLRDADVYYGPPVTYVRRPEDSIPVYRWTDRVVGATTQTKASNAGYYVDWDMPLRNLMQFMYDEAQSGRMMPAPRAILLPFVTTAVGPKSVYSGIYNIVEQMRAFWEARGRSLVQVGQVVIDIPSGVASGPGSVATTHPMWAVR